MSRTNTRKRLGLNSHKDVAYLTPSLKYSKKAKVLRLFDKNDSLKIIVASLYVLKVRLNLGRADAIIALDPT